MKRRKLIMFCEILALCLLIMSCSSSGNDLEPNEIGKKTGDIPLPYEKAYITDMKADGKKLMVSTIDVAKDFSSSTSEVWESIDEGENWKKIFEKQFVSDNSGEIYINTEIHFIGQGGILQVFQWPKDNANADYSKFYYINDFKDEAMKEVKTSHDMKNLGNTYFLNENNLYGWDFMNAELLRLNLSNGILQRKTFDDLSQFLDVSFDNHFAYISYLSNENEYAGIKYDVKKQKVMEAPIFDKMIKEFGREGYNPITGARFYPCEKDGKERYRYICSDGIFEFDESGSEKINSTVLGDNKENTDFKKIEVIGEDVIWVSYTCVNGSDEYRGIRRIDLKK